MSTRAKYLGAQGVVVDGCFRDVNEHRGMGFPVGGVVVVVVVFADWLRIAC